MNPPSRRPGEIVESAGSRAQRTANLGLLLKVAAALTVAWLLGRFADVVWPASLSDGPGRTSYSYKADGYRGSLEFAEVLGYRAEPRRASYGQLPPPDAGVLVVIDPLSRDELEERSQEISDGQTKTLEHWLDSGGRLVATAPARAVQSVSFLGAKVEVEGEAGDRRTVLDSALEHGFPRTEWIDAEGDLTWDTIPGGGSEGWTFPSGNGAWSAAPFLSSGPQPLRFPGGAAPAPAKLQVFSESVPDGCEIVARFGGHPFVLRRAEEAGWTWLVASAWPFSNLALARHGTGAFVARILAAAAEDGRPLYFDEYAHGLWERRGWLFWLGKDVLLYPALGLALVALLFFWRGSQRFGAAVPDALPPRRAKEEFVLGIADIALRAGRHRAAARSLLALHRARLDEHGLARDSVPDWAALEARVESPARFDLSALRALARDADTLYRRQLARAGLAAHAPAELASAAP